MLIAVNIVQPIGCHRQLYTTIERRMCTSSETFMSRLNKTQIVVNILMKFNVRRCVWHGHRMVRVTKKNKCNSVNLRFVYFYFMAINKKNFHDANETKRNKKSEETYKFFN